MQDPRPKTDQPSSKHVVIISTVLPRWIKDHNILTHWLARSGFQTTLYVPGQDRLAKTGWRTSEAIREFQQKLPDGVTLRFLPYASTTIGPVAALRSFLMSLRLAAGKRPSLAFFWHPISIVIFGPAFRFFRIPSIYFITGRGWLFSSQSEGAWQKKVAVPVYRYLLSGTRYRILVHNSEDKAYLSDTFGVKPDWIHVLPGCGVDPKEYPFSTTTPKNSTPIILAPVRLLVPKGVLDAAEASKLLTKRGIDHEMWFPSDLDESQPLSVTQADCDRIARESPGVRFKGHQSSLLEFYQKSDFVCVPTYYQEGLPTALMEAAAVGRPIVTTDNVGGRDFIRNDENGIIVPPKSPRALADAIERLINSPEDAERFRLAAYETYRKGYTKQDFLRITVNAFNQLLETPQQRSKVVP